MEYIIKYIYVFHVGRSQLGEGSLLSAYIALPAIQRCGWCCLGYRYHTLSDVVQFVVVAPGNTEVVEVFHV